MTDEARARGVALAIGREVYEYVGQSSHEEVERIIAASFAAVREECAKVAEEMGEKLLTDWSNDPDCPKKEHDASDCKSKCDAYCLMSMEAHRIAHAIRGTRG